MTDGSPPTVDDAEVPKRLSPINARGRRVFLRAIAPSDYEQLYEYELQPEMVPLYRHRGATPSPEAFSSSLWSGVTAQFAIASVRSGSLLGVAAFYSYDQRNGHGKLAGTLLPQARLRGWPVEGFALFLNYVFAAFPVRKVYGETPAPIASFFLSALGGVASVEGRLRGHEFFLGDYADSLIIAIEREEWLSSRVSRALLTPREPHGESE